MFFFQTCVYYFVHKRKECETLQFGQHTASALLQLSNLAAQFYHNRIYH